MSPASNSTSLAASDCGFAFANRLSENWIGRFGNMPEKPRFEGTPVVSLLVFGKSFRAAMGWNNGSARLKNFDYFDSYHRRASRRVYYWRAGQESRTGREIAAGRAQKKNAHSAACAVAKPAKAA